MLRTVFCTIAVLAFGSGALMADDKKGDNGLHAMFVKADVAKNTITFTTNDKTGKNVEMTLPLAKDAKLIGEDNKPETLAVFAQNLQKEKDKSILVVKDKGGKQIAQLKDLPRK
jgi:hypothetical protein